MSGIINRECAIIWTLLHNMKITIFRWRHESSIYLWSWYATKNNHSIPDYISNAFEAYKKIMKLKQGEIYYMLSKLQSCIFVYLTSIPPSDLFQETNFKLNVRYYGLCNDTLKKRSEGGINVKCAIFIIK